MWPLIFKVAALALLTTRCDGKMPEDDFRIINKQDLLATDSNIFEDKNSKSFSQLLFDVARDQVVVGARDAIYRLSLRGLRYVEKAEWPAPIDKAKACQDKGQTEDDCHNYIKVLLSSGDKLFACGTNAFSPQCSWREIESVGTVREWVTGEANCPYNPHSNVTALLTSTGEYYTGTPTDFAGSETAIYRSRGASENSINMLRTGQYDSNWLNEPQFVGSFEFDQFVYIVFREVAVEFMNCGKIVYSRIARVCKNDFGGLSMKKDQWSTFLKARLNCSVPGDYPFYYDEVQSIQYMDDQKILIAVFTTPSNSIAGSAICFYNMSDIRSAFNGAFKVQYTSSSTWEPKMPSNSAKEHFKCKGNLRPQEEMEYLPHHLMYEAIQPISRQPLYVTTLQRFTHVTADTTLAKNIGRQFVVFVATQDSNILKLAVLPHFKGACLVELWRLKDQKSGFDVQSIQFVKDTMSVYIGGTTAVLRVGAHRCERYSSRAACVGATDPYCGWHDARDACVEAALYMHEPQFAQNTDHCPLSDMPVDGGWSSWSDWSQCVQDSGLPHSIYSDIEKPDMCMCRNRECNNPKPTNGGQSCKGSNTAVSNCTVHGGWSSWSMWSECSATCGIAIKSRRRSCTSPEPKYGGRVCVGQDSMELYCSNLPPCPDPELAPVDGGWSAWAAWSACAGGSCGSGWRERRRSCSSPPPRYGGAACEGDALERRACELRSCDAKKTAWTPWVQLYGNGSGDGYSEKRFKFLCKVSASESIKLSVAKEEERYCTAPGACSEGGWEAWAGLQQRRRRPDAPRLEEWSCWSEWGSCSGPCGAAGVRTRTRRGSGASQRRLCYNSCPSTQADDGWGSWGEWSSCIGGARVRRRYCNGGECLGDAQLATCDDSLHIDNELSAMPVYSHTEEIVSFVTHATTNDTKLGAAGIVGCVLAAYLIGFLTCVALVAYCSRRRGRPPPWRAAVRVPSSPHYITAKQNSYVTVPLKDVPRKAKRQPSFTGIVSATGTLLTKSNNLSNAHNHNNTHTTPKLYPKAIANEYDSVGTLKRHSHQPNNKNNIDYEEDKFY